MAARIRADCKHNVLSIYVYQFTVMSTATIYAVIDAESEGFVGKERESDQMRSRAR
jgi:hypothetical protein